MHPIIHCATSIAIGTSSGSFGTCGCLEITLVGMGIGSVKNYKHRWLLFAVYAHIIAKRQILVNQTKNPTVYRVICPKLVVKKIY
jgi:hypothetical protein